MLGRIILLSNRNYYMLRYFVFLLSFLFYFRSNGQRLITQDEAVQAATGNQRNLRAANLSAQQQVQLLNSAVQLQSPQLFVEASPYEGTVVGAQQTLSLPSVYQNRKSLQAQRLKLAQLQLLGSGYELKRDVRLSYLQLQYLRERERILQYQDSIYSAIKAASKRFFEAGQINKLEELQATSQADKVKNDLFRLLVEIRGEEQIFVFYTNIKGSFAVEALQNYNVIPLQDTTISNIQLQVLQQQIDVSQRALAVEKAELLPQFQGGVLFPTTTDYERPVGYQLGVTIPIWRKQNRSRIQAAQTGIEIARAQQELEQQKLNAQYRQALFNLQKEGQSLAYFNNTALPQARAIIETSQRLFSGGELNYIESLRNLQTAFDIFFNHVEAHKAYNEAVIQLSYLNGTL